MEEHKDTLRERGIDVPDGDVPFGDEKAEELFDNVVDWGTNNMVEVTLTAEDWMHLHLGCLHAGGDYGSIAMPPDDFLPFLDQLVTDIFIEAPTDTEEVRGETAITIPLPYYYVGAMSSGLMIAAKQSSMLGGDFMGQRLAGLAQGLHQQVPEELNEVSHAANLLTLGEERYDEVTDALADGTPIEEIFSDEPGADPLSGPGFQ